MKKTNQWKIPLFKINVTKSDIDSVTNVIKRGTDWACGQEIEQLESRYEEQSDGKAKYSQFNKALSMRRKIKRGYTLDQQMVDNSEYAHLQYNSKDFNKGG